MSWLKKYESEEPDYSNVEMKSGGLIKRADGSYSKRGLWDNIRANKGSGKKPTKEMLEQERKIKTQEKKEGGPIEPEPPILAANLKPVEITPWSKYDARGKLSPKEVYYAEEVIPNAVRRGQKEFLQHPVSKMTMGMLAPLTVGGIAGAYLPAAASAAPLVSATGAAANAPILGVPGLTANNLLWGTGALASTNEIVDPNSATRTSINKAVEEPTVGNIAQAAGNTGLTALGYAGIPLRTGAASLADDFGKVLNKQSALKPYNLNNIKKIDLYNKNIVPKKDFLNQLEDIKRTAKVSDLDEGQLQKVLDKYPNLPIKENYVTNTIKIEDLKKAQDQTFNRSTDFRKKWIFKESPDDLIKELKASQIKFDPQTGEILTSAEDAKILKDLREQLENQPSVFSKESGDIAKKISDIEDKYYLKHFDDRKKIEEALLNKVRPEYIERLKNLKRLKNPNISDKEINDHVLSGVYKFNNSANQPSLLRLSDLSKDNLLDKLTKPSFDYLESGIRNDTMRGAKLPEFPITLGETASPPTFKIVTPNRSVKDIFTNPRKFIQNKPTEIIKTVNLTSIPASKVGGINIHELGHINQADFGFGDILAKSNPNYGYYTHLNTPFGDKFGKHLVKPVKPSKGEDFAYDTWLSSGNEIHSETEKARFLLFEEYLKKGLSEEAAMELLQNPSNEVLDDLIYIGRDKNVNSHFLPDTPREVKREIIKDYMPVIIPTAVGTGVGLKAASQTEQKQMGGWLNKYN